MTTTFQEIHNYKQEIKRLRLQILDITSQHSIEVKRLKQEILRPKFDLNISEADWTDAMRVACQMYDVTPDQVISQNRKQHIVFTRHLFTYLCRHHLAMTFTNIGAILRRDHSTIINAVNVYHNAIQYDKTTKRIYDKAVQLLGDYLHEREVFQHPHLILRRGSLEMQEKI